MKTDITVRRVPNPADRAGSKYSVVNTSQLEVSTDFKDVNDNRINPAAFYIVRFRPMVDW